MAAVSFLRRHDSFARSVDERGRRRRGTGAHNSSVCLLQFHYTARWQWGKVRGLPTQFQLNAPDPSGFLKRIRCYLIGKDKHLRGKRLP